MSAGPDPTTEKKIKISIELPEVFRSWFWNYYDHFGLLLLFNLGWSLCVLGTAWVGSLFWKGPSGDITVFSFCFLLLLLGSIVSIGWAYAVFKIFMDRQSNWVDILMGYRRFAWKGSLVAGSFWFVMILGAFNLRFLWIHPIPNQALNYVLFIAIVWILFLWTLIGFYLWPILFFQDAPVTKVFYRALILAWDSAGRNLFYLGVVAINVVVFTVLWPLWFFVGPASFFSLQSVALEKAFLKYRITYKDKDLDELLLILEKERERTWREFLRPWEHR